MYALQRNPSNIFDYDRANCGQWFYGVINTQTGDLFLVAGDVHDDPNNALQLNGRMLNTYASKPPVPRGGWASINAPGRDGERYGGIVSEPTGHMAVLKLYHVSEKDNISGCLGFRLIKINKSFATFSDRSNSLNADKIDQRNPNLGNPGPGGWQASGTARMPEAWRSAVVKFLKEKLHISHMALDH